MTSAPATVALSAANSVDSTGGGGLAYAWVYVFSALPGAPPRSVAPQFAPSTGAVNVTVSGLTVAGVYTFVARVSSLVRGGAAATANATVRVLAAARAPVLAGAPGSLGCSAQAPSCSVAIALWNALPAGAVVLAAAVSLAVLEPPAYTLVAVLAAGAPVALSSPPGGATLLKGALDVAMWGSGVPSGTFVVRARVDVAAASADGSTAWNVTVSSALNETTSTLLPPYVVRPLAFGACTPACGAGSQSRALQCVDSRNASVVGVGVCGLTSAVEAQGCLNKPCGSRAWLVGAWSACSVPCGGSGSATRSVQCVAGTGPSNLAPVLASQCLSDATAGPQPATSQACGQVACDTYSWVPAAWSACSASCGGGTQSRGVACVGASGAFSAQALLDCVGSPPPAAAQVCAAAECTVYYYAYGPWSSCPSPCGGGAQSRPSKCMELATGGVVADFLCSTRQGPGVAADTSRLCNSAPCPAAAAVWVISAPNATRCRARSGVCTGTVSRSVVCSVYGVAASAARCAALPPPPRASAPCQPGMGLCDICQNTTCSFHGTCSNVTNACACGAGYAGRYCEQNPTCAGGLRDGNGACCGSGLVDTFGTCCAAGAVLSSAGVCCSVGVDVCGVCGGSSTVVAVTGDCCTQLDASGACCLRGLDVCGVCAGDGTTCTLTVSATLQAVSGAALAGVAADALSPAAAALAAGVAAALAARTNRTSGSVSVTLGVSPSRRVRALSGGTAAPIAIRFLAPQTLDAGLLPALVTGVASPDFALSGVSPASGVGVCGNGVCVCARARVRVRACWREPCHCAQLVIA